ncbi:CASP8-associated protein 2 [Archocentrus centrarchus]|uniref:CASP8-associated protein 2 n=1 Tax=Archocentrus centrarchus TaxID=63155 RepID=UPI0011E9B67E|nr:CASP8-associated protein 2 [Archocentrus centrarchus]XP_030578145.1 CASP8-associated protein 2 [Archocentrus centrarchus]XP_030578146.1 CASP8-associated protein 2 [Archocentrus centrarchus]
MENTDTSHASGRFVPEVSEESVDIYDGLDIGFSSNAEEPPSVGSQLKESMDLYEEIVTEEQQSRESSYIELKSRFQAAQNHIKELHRRLEQLELQNTGLRTENSCLKKNISALLQTARKEVTRKDAEIQRLSQWSERVRHHYPSHIKNLPDPNSSSHSSTSRVASPPPPSNPHFPPLPKSPSRVNQPPRDGPQSIRKESDSLPRASKASCHSHSKKDSEVTDKQTESDKQKSSRGEHKPQSHKSESVNRRHKSVSDPNSDYHPHEQNRSHRADKDMGQRYDSRSCRRKSYPCEERHRSDRAKSSPEILQSAPSSDNKKDGRRQDKGKLTASDPKHGTCLDSKGHYSRALQKIKITGGSSRSYNSKDWKKSSVSQHAVHCRDSSKEREGARQRDYQWKGERQHKGKISKNDTKNSQSQTRTEREKLRTKESSKGKIDICDKDRREKTSKAFKRSFEKDNMSKKNSFEESSPNRKLCFMETLNLTLSPIKKPMLSTDGSQKDPVPMDRDVENGSDEDNLQPNIEDMCVIDDIENSELGGELREIAEQSLNNHKALSFEKTLEASDVVVIQEKDKGCSETLTADISVQTVSAHSQPLDTAEKQTPTHPTAKSPENDYLKPDMSKSHQENIEPISDSKAAECQMVKATDGIDPIDKSESISEQSASYDLQKVYCENNADLCASGTKSTVVDSSVETLETTAQQSIAQDSDTGADSSHPKKTNTPKAEAMADKASPESHHSPLTVKSQVGQQGSPASSNSIHMKDNCQTEDCRKDTDAVSSTISLESLPQEGLSLTEAIYVLTQTDEDSRDSSTSTTEPSSSTGCIGVSKVSSTTQEKTQPESYTDVTVTPNKHFSPKKGQENKFKCSSSVPLLHDEDSMMRTLSSLKKIPDAISPLRSPVRVIKRSLLHVHGKPGHVKCLQKDFSSTPVDASSKKLDVNKENKYPGSPAKRDALNLVDKVSDLPSARSDTDLEEGEILSESDEVSASSPAAATRRAKLVQPVTNKSSPKSALNKKFAERRVASKESHDISGVTTQSPKSRFKTVCPAASKAAFCTIEEIMETFQLVRTEIRKKYMKLHKTFPKKSFYGMMENFQRSFLEFVDGAHFGQICDQPGELKSKLKKLIESVFGKVSNNGIVKRIFEQQAVDLKQKLWDFVNVQVDYLFVDIHTTLKGLCKASRTQPEDKRSSEGEKVSQQLPARTPSRESDQVQPASTILNQTKSCAVVPYKTGLGSRGKDIRITHLEKDRTAASHPLNPPRTQPIDEFLPPKNPPSTPEKNNLSSLVVAQNGSFDKTDFELLTEQQASSLTFNLVRDSQMGEIFKCLLQGSDLLENSGIAGENSAWSLSTPRKDGERFISIHTPSKSPSKLLSPNKFDTPSKLIATWASISPRKMSSPHPKDQATLNPALLDENCLLEVPSENRALTSLASQKSYSLLAEDLAVSLTIPSPLKSDSHLSFLQPTSPSMRTVSTPENVISAHICEDALLDGEDATEHDIHLALDTDNSSCGSSSSSASQTPATSFVLKPDMTMQALVTEKSNDHFIVKIRQANPGADSTLTADESLSETLIDEQHAEHDSAAQDSGADVSDKLQNAVPSERSLFNLAEGSASCSADTESSNCLTQVKNLTLLKDQLENMSTQQNTSKDTFSKESLKNLPESSPSDNSSNNESAGQTHFREENITQEIPSKTLLCKSQNKIIPSRCALSNNSRPSESSLTNQKSQELFSLVSDSESNDVDISESDKSLTIAEATSSSPEKEQRDSNKGRKRKKHQEKSKAKRIRKETKESTEEVVCPSKEADEDSKSFSMACLSPSSLSAKNVIRRKGEVVMAWTRDEDRAILMDMKTKGASRETFSALSEKLNKPSGQIAHRFYQLMKLFKKMDA